MRPPSLSEVEALAATARCVSMSAAAPALGLRQPTVSAHLAWLETRCGVALFHRRGQHVQLSEFGSALRDATHRILCAKDDALALLGQVSLAMSVGNSSRIAEQVLDFRGDLGLLMHGVDDPRLVPVVAGCLAMVDELRTLARSLEAA